MKPDETLADLRRAPVRFWACLNPDHQSAKWSGDVATCADCGLTSEMTSEYAQRVREHERAKIADMTDEWGRDLMDKAIEQVMNDEPGGQNAVMRAATVAYVAKLVRKLGEGPDEA